MRGPATEPEAAASRRPDSPLEGLLADAGIRLGALLHRGAVSEVWRATLTGGEAATVKAPVAALRGSAGAAELLRREYRALEVLRHPHVLRALGLVDRPGCTALVTELLPAGDLVSLAGGPPRHWSGPALDVLHALDAVHCRGWVHGDVKARNVLFDAAGRPKLVDFGSALPIGHGRPAGGATPAHAPLHFRLERASPAVDVYAFAVLLYELSAGRLPFGPEPAAHPDAAGRAPPASVSCDADGRLVALGSRITAVLEAREPDGVGTLLDFVDVLESLHGGPAR